MLIEYIKKLKNFLIGNIDIPLLLIILLLMGTGLITIYSATYDTGIRMVNGQITNIFIGLFVMWVVAKCPPKYIMLSAAPLYTIALILLILIFPFGVSVKGAKRWLSLGFMRIQPSEIMKIALPLMLAWFFFQFKQVSKYIQFPIALIFLIIPFLLIVKQPDLGTAILVGSAGFYVIFFAGLPWKVILGVLLAGAAYAPFAWTKLHGYQHTRILTLLNPSSDPLGAGYHISQSTIAMGSGGVSGKGWLAGTQTRLEFLPERHTDFIFAVFSEEHGLIGGAILLVLYLLLVFRGLEIAYNAKDIFSKTLGGAISLGFFTYAFVNMGMVIGILPVVGVPLPFMSYGGSAIIMLFLGVGMLMSIQTHQKSKDEN